MECFVRRSPRPPVLPCQVRIQPAGFDEPGIALRSIPNDDKVY